MKKISRRSFLQVTSMGVITAGLVACGSDTSSTAADSTASTSSVDVEVATDDPVELRISWWGGDSRHEATLEALELYTQKHPNVTFSPEYSGWDGYHDKVITQIATATEPDIMQIDNTGYFSDLAINDSVTDLTPYFGSVIDLSEYSESALEWAKYGDKQYGIPTGLNGIVLMYNKSLFDAASVEYPTSDWSWEELEDALLTIHENNPDVYGIKEPSNWHIVSMMRQNGSWYTDEDGVAQDFTDGLTATFAKFQEWRDLEILPPVDLSSGQNTQQDNLFYSAQAATQIQPIAQFVMDETSVGSECGLCMMPGAKDDSSTYVMASMPWFIGKSSANQAVAADVVNFLINDPEAAVILKTERGVPGSSYAIDAIGSVVSASELLVLQGTNEIEASTQRIDYDFLLSGNSICSTTIETCSLEVAYGSKTPEEAAQSAYATISAEMF